jgi:hypothetical protein
MPINRYRASAVAAVLALPMFAVGIAPAHAQSVSGEHAITKLRRVDAPGAPASAAEDPALARQLAALPSWEANDQHEIVKIYRKHRRPDLPAAAGADARFRSGYDVNKGTAGLSLP